MLQDSATLENRYHKFIKKVCETQIVIGLKGTNGFAVSISNNFIGDDDEEIDLLCFWSEKAYARACSKDEWRNYKIEDISLASFLENWCIGMHYDGAVAGIELDQNLFGFEIDPLELGLELINEIKEQNINVALRKYNSIEDLEKEIKEIIEK